MSAPSEPKGAAERSRTEIVGLPQRILYLGSSDADRAPALAFLRDSGSEIVRVDAAASGPVERQAFDLILVEIAVANADGYALVRRMRDREAERGCARVPIIALDERAHCRAAAPYIAAGCDARVASPVAESQLVEAIRDCTEAVRFEPDAAIADLIPDYLEHRWSDIDMLWNALAGGDWALVRRLGHDMKGSGKLYGLPRVSEVGARLEAAGKAEDRPGASAALSSLESLIARVARQTGHPLPPPAGPAFKPPASASG